ncbi:division/cell wall cluster transcriptional repressor MraZ [Candidatus Cytomitobacter primus]|uniref:Transcriptional regulator MraZ n=1 Tax=Candidatus Cytomitobacter primus TaxID=2066024 RepID=A0A5C0UEU4_9PROT|nr:hypothetical protein [Candidatus Cytomitobacter primus]QEK38616.1 hypothetical protein FZC34_01695 [Candidatus Cytomitobacter primus]
MNVFLSTYEKKIDKKGRVSTPGSFRNILSKESFNGFIAFKSYFLPTIDCFGISKMEKLSDKLENENPFTNHESNVEENAFADAIMIQFDNEGRATISKDLLEHAQISSDLLFIGKGSTFQIWEPNLFQEHQENMRKRIKKEI